MKWLRHSIMFGEISSIYIYLSSAFWVGVICELSMYDTKTNDMECTIFYCVCYETVLYNNALWFTRFKLKFSSVDENKVFDFIWY